MIAWLIFGLLIVGFFAWQSSRKPDIQNRRHFLFIPKFRTKLA
jgi:hypothetical protein